MDVDIIKAKTTVSIDGREIKIRIELPNGHIEMLDVEAEPYSGQPAFRVLTQQMLLRPSGVC